MAEKLKFRKGSTGGSSVNPDEGLKAIGKSSGKKGDRRGAVAKEFKKRIVKKRISQGKSDTNRSRNKLRKALPAGGLREVLKALFS